MGYSVLHVPSMYSTSYRLGLYFGPLSPVSVVAPHTCVQGEGEGTGEGRREGEGTGEGEGRGEGEGTGEGEGWGEGEG